MRVLFLETADLAQQAIAPFADLAFLNILGPLDRFAQIIMGRDQGQVLLTPAQRAQARHFKQIEEATAAGEPSLPGRGTLCGCGGAFGKIAVHHNGTLVPCHILPTLHMGTIGEDRLQQVWLEHPTMIALE